MMACARSATCSLVKMFETWLRTVFWLRCRCLAIEDLALAVGQLGEGIFRHARAGSGEVVHQAFGDGRAEHRFSTGDGPNGAQDLAFKAPFSR